MVKDKDVSQKDWRYEPDTFDYARYKVHFIALALAALIGIGVLLNLPSYWENVFITAIGLAFTVFILDKNAEDRAIRQRKEELILQMGSPDHGFAVEAARLLKLKGWLMDGSLNGVNLIGANLQGSILAGAELQRGILVNAILQKANLIHANLQGALMMGARLEESDLTNANMQEALLRDANLDGALLLSTDLKRANMLNTSLQRAVLQGAELQGARLHRADLQNAILFEANLQAVLLDNVSFSMATLLPDGSHWTPDTDMTRFTDPNHPQFWRSDDPQSPAYRAREG